MKSFGKIQRLAWYEIGRNKMKAVLSVIGIGIAYLLILLPMYATEYDENGISVYAVLIAIITLIGTKSAYGMFRDLYFAPEDNSPENSATPQERYLSKVWVVIYMHLIPAIAIGLIGIVIASIVDDSLWAAKNMLLVTPIMACVMMAVDAIMVICAVYSGHKGKKRAVLFLFLSVASGLAYGILRGLLMVYAGKVRKPTKIIFPWGLRYILNNSAAHKGLRYAEIAWLLQGLFYCVLCIAVIVVLCRVYCRYASSRSDEKDSDRCLFGAAVTTALVMTYGAVFLIGFQILPLLPGIILFYWLIYDRYFKPQKDSTRLLQWGMNFLITTAAYVLFSLFLYFTSGLGTVYAKSPQELGDAAVLIEIQENQNAKSSILIYGGKYSVMYHPDGNGKQASVLSTDVLTDKQIREATGIVQTYIAHREKDLRSFFQLLFRGDSGADVPGVLTAKPRGSDTKCTVCIFRLKQNVYDADSVNIVTDTIDEMEIVLKQEGYLTGAQAEELVEELRKTRCLSKGEGVLFNDYWNLCINP